MYIRVCQPCEMRTKELKYCVTISSELVDASNTTRLLLNKSTAAFFFMVALANDSNEQVYLAHSDFLCCDFLLSRWCSWCSYYQKCIIILQSRAGQYVGIYRTGAIALKYRDAISKRYNKTDYQDIEISQWNRKYRNIFRVEQLKWNIMKNLHLLAKSAITEPKIRWSLGLSRYAI